MCTLLQTRGPPHIVTTNTRFGRGGGCSSGGGGGAAALSCGAALGSTRKSSRRGRGPRFFCPPRPSASLLLARARPPTLGRPADGAGKAPAFPPVNLFTTSTSASALSPAGLAAPALAPPPLSVPSAIGAAVAPVSLAAPHQDHPAIGAGTGAVKVTAPHHSADAVSFAPPHFGPTSVGAGAGLVLQTAQLSQPPGCWCRRQHHPVCRAAPRSHSRRC